MTQKTKLKLGILFLILLGLQTQLAAAQEGLDPWTPPVNLSQSGAADEGTVVTSADGRIQAFWNDQFDGLVTAVFNGESWSAPQLVSFEMTNRPVTPEKFLIDNNNFVHVFGTDEFDGNRRLIHGFMRFGETRWRLRSVVTDSVIAYDVAHRDIFGLVVAYLRTNHSVEQPAGLYTQRWTSTTWSVPSGVYPSIYFRLLTDDNAYIDLTSGEGGQLHLIWEEPRLGEYLYTYSPNVALTWSEPESLGSLESGSVRPRTIILPSGQPARLWQEFGITACRIYQQDMISGGDNGEEPIEWSERALMLLISDDCPEEEQFLQIGEQLVWQWGIGSGAIKLSAWDEAAKRWSDPQFISFSFEAGEVDSLVVLDTLHATFTSDGVAVIGTDRANGEVWSLSAAIDPQELSFSDLSTWIGLVPLSDFAAVVDWSSVAVGGEGEVHVVWSESAPFGSLVYAGLEGDIFSAEAVSSLRAEVVSAGAGEQPPLQPDLLIDPEEVLHLVWSGGTQGQVLYSRASADSASLPDGWDPPRELSLEGLTSWPQIVRDGSGWLYVVYVVPVNDGRGVYLVTSTDDGNSWGEPVLIFDAEAEGWSMVDHPALEVAADGTLYLSWVQKEVPGLWVPTNVYFATLDGINPEQVVPQKVADAGFDWPQLALLDEEAHLVFQDSTTGLAWHRWSRLDAGDEGQFDWSLASNPPEWPAILGSTGLSADGGDTLHLAGVASQGDKVVYSSWQEGRWREVEGVPFAVPLVDSLGVNVDAPLTGGRFGVTLLASLRGEDVGRVPMLYYTVRNIPSVDVPQVAAPPRPTQTPTAVVVEIEEPVEEALEEPAAEAGLVLADVPPPPESSISPLALAVAPVVLIIVIFFFGRSWMERRD